MRHSEVRNVGFKVLPFYLHFAIRNLNKKTVSKPIKYMKALSQDMCFFSAKWSKSPNLPFILHINFSSDVLNDNL